MKLHKRLLITIGILGVITVLLAVPVILWITTADGGATIFTTFVVIGVGFELVRSWRTRPKENNIGDSP